MPQSSNRGAVQMSIESDFPGLVQDLKQVQPDMLRGLRQTVRRQGGILLGRVKANAAWSSRIPAATRLTTRFTAKSATVTIVTDRNKAPHARPLERGSKKNRGKNRHPVYGNRENWVDQPLRPYMLKAADEPFRAQTQAEVADSMDRALRRAGFR